MRERERERKRERESVCEREEREKEQAIEKLHMVELLITTIFNMLLQEVVTLQKKNLIYLHQKMRFTQFINYYNT